MKILHRYVDCLKVVSVNRKCVRDAYLCSSNTLPVFIPQMHHDQKVSRLKLYLLMLYADIRKMQQCISFTQIYLSLYFSKGSKLRKCERDRQRDEYRQRTCRTAILIFS